LADALAAELGELIIARGVPTGLLHEALPFSLPAAMDAAAGERAAIVGAKLAATVYGALEAAGRPGPGARGREWR
jgi:hypothetical protein